MQTPYFEDLHPGYRIASETLRLSKEDIIAFARQWDPQPFHVDESAARSSIFGRLVASGVHVYASSIRLCADAGAFSGNAIGLGVDAIRFLAPVYPGDALGITLTVRSLRNSASRPDYGVVCWDLMTTEQTGREVLSAEINNLFRRRGG